MCRKLVNSVTTYIFGLTTEAELRYAVPNETPNQSGLHKRLLDLNIASREKRGEVVAGKKISYVDLAVAHISVRHQ